MTPEIPVDQVNPWSRTLGKTALAILMGGGLLSMFPLWKSATLSPESIMRRVYWTTAAVGLPLVFCSQLPYWAPASLLTILTAMGWLALALRAGHIKIDGQVYAMHTRPDRPPALRDEDDPSDS